MWLALADFMVGYIRRGWRGNVDFFGWDFVDVDTEASRVPVSCAGYCKNDDLPSGDSRDWRVFTCQMKTIK